jgi:hypothetical protein
MDEVEYESEKSQPNHGHSEPMTRVNMLAHRPSGPTEDTTTPLPVTNYEHKTGTSLQLRSLFVTHSTASTDAAEKLFYHCENGNLACVEIDALRRVLWHQQLTVAAATSSRFATLCLH